MELNWSTFVLEIINFLVLVWILKRFLYKPVLEVIARRRAAIEESLSEAKQVQEDAMALQSQYQNRLEEWDRERQQARESLAREIEAERSRRLDDLNNELVRARRKSQVADEHREADSLKKIEATALEHGARLAAYLLGQAAGPETEARLVQLATRELSRLPPEAITRLRNSYGKPPELITVQTAYTLAADKRQDIEQALHGLTNGHIPVRFDENADLVAGIHITFGAWALDANLRDELRGFTDLIDV